MAIYKTNDGEAMSTAIAIFVKTPSFSLIKTRLAETLGNEKALEFYHLSLDAISQVIDECDISPYWAVAEEEGLREPLWQGYPSLYTGGKGLGECQYHIYETLLKEYNKVLLIGADAPQISQNIIDQAIEHLDTNDFVIGPASDGGYYLFGGRKSTPSKMWEFVPWSTSSTREILEGLLPSMPAHCMMLTDVDIEENLAKIGQEMLEYKTLGQQRLLEWLETNNH